MVLGNLVVLQNEWQAYDDATIITVHRLIESFTHAFTSGSRCMLQNWRGTALAENNDVGNRFADLGN